MLKEYIKVLWQSKKLQANTNPSFDAPYRTSQDISFLSLLGLWVSLLAWRRIKLRWASIFNVFIKEALEHIDGHIGTKSME